MCATTFSSHFQTPRNSSRKRPRRNTRASSLASSTLQQQQQDTSSSAQVSFEDSNLENEPDSNKPAAKRKRATKVTRSRPVRKTKGSVSILDESGTLGILKEANASDDVSTPVHSGKKKLYKQSVEAEQFTPTEKAVPGAKDTPGTIVKRQLRLRSSKKY